MAHKVRSLVLMLAVLVCLLRPGPLAAAKGITLIPGTVTLDASQQAALVDAFDGAATYLPTTVSFVAVTGLTQSGGWDFVSVAGFEQYDPGKPWLLDDATWIGLALMTQPAGGGWQSAVQGAPNYESLLASIPDGALSASARASLSPARRMLTPAQAYRFPWAAGTSMLYGTLGIHAGGFASLGDYKAVDFLSDGNTAAGHAPNQLLAAASGAINYVCNDGVTVAIRIGDLLYLHLLSNTSLAVGHSFNQGDTMGQLKMGSFSANCGYASQSANWFHVHWAFPNTGEFQAGGWALEFSDQLWHRGTQTVGTNQWMLSDSNSTSWAIDYFTDKTLSARCGGASDEITYVFKQWGADAPVSGCPANTFGARITKQVSFQGGNYTLHLQRAGQARVYVDGQMLIDLWQAGDGGLEATRVLTGVHEVKVEFAGAQSLPILGVWWYGPGALPVAPMVDPSLWQAEYYGNYSLWGLPALVQNESGIGINHDWGDGGPTIGFAVDNWSARFTRDVAFGCGTYHFSVHVDDAVRVWVGNQLILDEWRDQWADFTADVNLYTGTLPVKVEYYEHGGGAALAVNWQLTSSGTCAAAMPDLRPDTPVGWSSMPIASPMRASYVTGTLIAGQPAYFDWAVINDSPVDTSGGFDVEVWIDNVRAVMTSTGSLAAGGIDTWQDWAIDVITPGLHTVKVMIDPQNAIAEMNETNNTSAETFYWQPDPATFIYQVFVPIVYGY